MAVAAPGAAIPIDAELVKRVTGLNLPPVDPSTVPGGVSHLPGGSAIRAFGDASGSRVLVVSIVLPGLASKMLFAAMSRTSSGGANNQRQPVEGLGDAAYWVQDRALVVQHGDGIVTVDVESSSLSSAERAAAAKSLATYAMGISMAAAQPAPVAPPVSPSPAGPGEG